MQNKIRKICVVITTRGNYAKMKSVLFVISKNPRLKLQLVLGNNLETKRYGDFADHIKKDGFKIDDNLEYFHSEDSSLSMTLSAGLATYNLGKIFNKLKPNIVIVIADRYEALSVAHAATCMNIKIAHLEGGEISGSIDERIRHSITKLSHIHFPSNQESADRIIKMGEASHNVFIVGSPSIDLIANINFKKINKLQKIIDQNSKIKLNLKDDYIVVSQHSVVTENENAKFQIQQTLYALKNIKLPIVWLYPNMDVGQETIVLEVEKSKVFLNIVTLSSLKMEDYAILLKNASCLVGNSSSGIRECEYLGVPVVNIGTRQNNRLRGQNVKDVGYNSSDIFSATKYQIDHGSYQSEFIYGNGLSSKKIVNALIKCDLKLEKFLTF